MISTDCRVPSCTDDRIVSLKLKIKEFLSKKTHLIIFSFRHKKKTVRRVLWASFKLNTQVHCIARKDFVQ